MYKVPPLLNRFRLPSSHEKSKPAQGCHGAGLGHGSPKPIPPAKAFADSDPAGTSSRPSSLVRAKKYNTRGPSGASSLGTAPSRQSQRPLCAREPHVALVLSASCRDGAPRPGDTIPKAIGRQKRWLWWRLPCRHWAVKARAVPARHLRASWMGDVPRGCWHMLAKGEHAFVGTLPAGNRDTGLPCSAASCPPAPPREICEPGGLSALAAQQTAGQQPAAAALSPAPRQALQDPFLKARKGFGAGRASPPGIFCWTTDSAEVPEQVEFLSTKRLLTLERLMWERDLSPSQSSLCWRH